MKIIRKSFTLTVSSADSTFKETFDIDKNVSRITGLLFTANLDAKLFYRASCGVYLSGEEVFPDDYQCKLLMNGLGVPAKERYFPIDFSPGNYQVKIHITDSSHPTEIFTAYDVTMYLEMETQ